MAVAPVKKASPPAPAARAPAQTPAQIISAEVISDGAKVKLLFTMATTNPKAFKDQLAKHVAGQSQPLLAAYDRMIARTATGWKEKVGNVTVNKTNLTAAAQATLNGFGAKKSSYGFTINKNVEPIWTAQRNAAYNAVANYESAMKNYTGSPMKLPSYTATKETIDRIDTTWPYMTHLNKVAAAEKTRLKGRMAAALAPRVVNNPHTNITSIRFKNGKGNWVDHSMVIIKPGQPVRMEVRFKTPASEVSSAYFASSVVETITNWPPQFQKIKKFKIQFGHFSLLIKPDRTVEVQYKGIFGNP